MIAFRNMKKPHLFSIFQNWQAVTMTGPDARDYLQRLSSANFKQLPPGRFTPATLLSATGKIQIYFKAIALAPERYLLLVPQMQEGQTAAQFGFETLEKMHF